MTCTHVFTAALFTAAQSGKRPKCSSGADETDQTWAMHTVEYYSALKRRGA